MVRAKVQENLPLSPNWRERWEAWVVFPSVAASCPPERAAASLGLLLPLWAGSREEEEDENKEEEEEDAVAAVRSRGRPTSPPIEGWIFQLFQPVLRPSPITEATVLSLRNASFQRCGSCSLFCGQALNFLLEFTSASALWLEAHVWTIKWHWRSNSWTCQS